MKNNQLIIFDGVCNFCNSAVNFIIKRDPQAVFKFVPLQSDLAQSLLDKHNLLHGPETFVLIGEDDCFIMSDAILEIVKQIQGYWYLLGVLRIIPRPMRNFFYMQFGKRRYTLFGKSDYCVVPSNEIKARFITDEE